MTLNQYIYCFNNPWKYVDPSGHWPKWAENTGKWVKKKAADIVEKTGKAIDNTVKYIRGIDWKGISYKGGKVLYTASELILGGLTTAGGVVTIPASYGGSLVIVAHGTNSVYNGGRDALYIWNGEWDKVGNENFLLDNVYKPAGGEIGERFGNEWFGEKVGSVTYYCFDILTGIKGTIKSFQILKNKKYGMLRQVVDSDWPGNTKWDFVNLKKYSKEDQLGAFFNIVKDLIGDFFNSEGIVNEFR